MSGRCKQCKARLRVAYTYKPGGKPGEMVPLAHVCLSGHYTLLLPDAGDVKPSGSASVLVRIDRVMRVWGIARWANGRIAISKKQEVSE